MDASNVGTSPSPTGPVSLDTMRLALSAMKERCSRSERRTEELERDNLVLRSSRSELYREVKRLHEANVKLREKNLQLNDKVHKKAKENVEVRDQLHSLQDQHSDSIRQLERLQDEVSAITTDRSRENGVVQAEEEEEEEEDSKEGSPMSLEETAVDASSSTHQMDQSVLTSSDQMLDIKTRLLDQQEMLRKALDKLRRDRERQLEEQREQQRLAQAVGGGGHHRGSPQVSLADTGIADDGGSLRTCPMCEASFPNETTQDEFEKHVVEHFSYEESNTLTNTFEMVNDGSEF